MARSLIMNDAIVYGGQLIVATGDASHRQCRLWALDGDQRWRDVSGAVFEGGPSRHPGGMWIYVLATDGSSLFAGTAGHQGSARVFRYAPASFEPE